jgi:hypothetical protein
MTLPDERYRAVMQTMQFLADLSTPSGYKRVPKEVRAEARRLLRHYPSSWDMKRTAENCPEVFQERMEPVYRMIKQYEEGKKDEA